MSFYKNADVEQLHSELIKAVADNPEPVPCELNPEPYMSNWSSRQNADADSAFELCADCPFMIQCAEFARANEEEYGVWGGELPRDRLS